jgi:hypothetical protein
MMDTAPRFEIIFSKVIADMLPGALYEIATAMIQRLQISASN